MNFLNTFVHSIKHPNRHMRKIIAVILCAFPLLLGCDKDSNKDSAEYYVKYEYGLAFNPNFGSKYYNKTISINTENGVKEFTTTSNSFTETIGPVKKGFNANITVQYTDGGSGGGTPSTKIYVSRGSEPFALKASNNTSSASYTIDY